jgi:hypothetical protein
MANWRKRLKPFIDAAEEAGWKVEVSGTGHPMLYPPPGTVDPRTGGLAGPVKFAASPSDRRGDLNSRAQLRRLGLDV